MVTPHCRIYVCVHCAFRYMQLSPVADFVEVSKKQRAIGKLEKSAIVAADAFKSARASNYITGCSIAMPYVRMVAYGAVALAFWPTPVANMPPSWFAPLGWTLRLPGQPPGSISAPAWVGICYTVISPLLYAVARAANLLPHERRGLAGGIAGRITQMFT